METSVCITCPAGSPFVAQERDDRSDLFEAVEVTGEYGRVVARVRRDENGDLIVEAPAGYRISGRLPQGPVVLNP